VLTFGVTAVGWRLSGRLPWALLVGPTGLSLVGWMVLYYPNRFTANGASTAEDLALALKRDYPTATYRIADVVATLPQEFPVYLGRTLHLTHEPAREIRADPGGTVLIVERGVGKQPPAGAEPITVYTFAKRSWDVVYLPSR
jgi:hypothetical protein